MLPQIPEGISPAFYFLCAGCAVFIMGIAKAGFGGGIGVLAVPLLALAYPANQTSRVLGVMLPVLICADIFANLHHLRYQSGRHLRWLLLGAVVGIAIATVLLFQLTPAAGLSDAARIQATQQSARQLNVALNLTVGGLCLLLVLMQAYRLFGGKVPHLPDRPLSGYLTGGVSGMVSTLAHSAGPVVNIYLLEQKLEKRLIVGTSAAFFLLTNVAKVPSFVALSSSPGAAWWIRCGCSPWCPWARWLGFGCTSASRRNPLR